MVDIVNKYNHRNIQKPMLHFPHNYDNVIVIQQ